MNGYPFVVITRPLLLIGWHSLVIGIELSSLEVERPSVVAETERASIVAERPSIVLEWHSSVIGIEWSPLVIKRPSVVAEI